MEAAAATTTTAAVTTKAATAVRGVIRKFAEIIWLTFLHRLFNRAGNTATHIGYNMLDVSRLRALQLSSRQSYIARAGPFYVAF